MSLKLPRQQRPPAWAPTAFVSYSHADAGMMERIVTHLRRGGIYVLGDFDYLETGAEYLGIIEQLIDRAHVFVFLLSRHSLASRACRTEFERAATKQKLVLPVRLDPDVAVADTPFATIEMFDLAQPDEQALDRLLHHVREKQPSTLRRMFGL